MKTPDERLAFLLESGRREIPRGNGKQRALLALDAAQTGQAVKPGVSNGALAKLREPSPTTGLVLKLSLAALLTAATSSMIGHAPLALGSEPAPAAARSSVETASLASESEPAPAVEPASRAAATADEDFTAATAVVTPSALPSAPLPPASPRTRVRAPAAAVTQAPPPQAAMTGDLPPPARSAPPPSTASVTGTETTSGTDWLRDELALVDEASRALSLGRCDEAEQALARYRERFPSGLLRSEIDVISVEAIGMRGDHDRAAARAQRFLSLHPKSPYAARLSTWLSGHPGIAGARSCIPSP